MFQCLGPSRRPRRVFFKFWGLLQRVNLLAFGRRRVGQKLCHNPGSSDGRSCDCLQDDRGLGTKFLNLI